MPRYAQLVMGPAGSGKSTYCSTMVRHAEAERRSVHVVNLDPAAEYFDYPVMADVRELISLDDTMEDDSLHFGPNGGLIFCMEYLAENFDWLEEQLGEIEDDYVIFDLPGQIELYTHLPVMRKLVEHLQNWNFNICGIFLIDAQFMIDASKFISGVMTALSAMISLEIPHINVLTKLDLLNKAGMKDLERYLDPDVHLLLAEELNTQHLTNKFQRLNQAIATVIDDYSLVKFVPLNITDEESVETLLMQVDQAMQWGEEKEPREPKDMDIPDKEDEADS